MKSLKYSMLIAPALILSLMIVLIPGLLTVYVSFTSWNGVSSGMDWVGLQNYRDLFDNRVFWQSLFDNVRWVSMFLTIPVVIGMVSAFLLLRRKKSRNAYQMIFLFPYVLAPVTNAILWLNIIFNPISGLVGFLRNLGLHVSAPLGNVNTALYAVAMVDIWHYWGFLTIVYLAALRQTPLEQVESATVEGANGWELFRHIYLPSIMPTLLLMFVFITIFSFSTFDYIYLLTGGGPAHATEMLSTLAYSFAFSAFEVGKASAVGVVISFFGLIASFFYTWLSQKDVTA